MSVRRRAAAPPAVADQIASSGVMPMSRTARAMQNGMEDGEGGAGVAVGGQGDRGAGVQQPAGVRLGGAGGELGAGQQGGHRVAAAPERVDVGVGEVGAVVGGGRVEFDGELDAGAVAELVGVDPRMQALGTPAVRIARAWSPSKAPRSQKTSIQRACGAQASSISPVTRCDIGGRVVGVLGRRRCERRGR